MYNEKITEAQTFDALKYRVVIDNRGNKHYYNHNNQLHREFGPAIEFTSGSKFWYLNDKLHRTDGPAIEYLDGGKVWRINGEVLTEREFLSHLLCTVPKSI